MSKKVIPFHMPNRNGDETSSPVPETVSAVEGGGIDQWVHRQETPAEITLDHPIEAPEADADRFSITISGTPNVFDLARLGLFLPYLTMWMWTLSAAEKNLELFGRFAGRKSTS